MSLGQPSPPGTSMVTGGTQLPAQQNQAYNVAAQAGSMIGQQGPYGSLNYVQTGTGPGGVPIYTAINKLSPAQQKLLKQYQQAQLTAGGEAGKLLSGANYGSTSPTTAIGDIASGLTGQGMQQGMEFLTPFFDTETSHLDAQLKNQGLMPGEPAYDIAMRQLRTNQGLQVNNLLESLFPKEQQFAMQEYGLPMQMAESLMGVSAPANLSTGFTSALPGLQGPNYASLYDTTAKSQLAQYQAQQAQYNAMMSGLFGTGANVLGGMVMA